MRVVKAVYLDDEDIADASRPGMLAVHREAELQCIDASLVLWGDRVLKNRLGVTGRIAQQRPDQPRSEESAPSTETAGQRAA